MTTDKTCVGCGRSIVGKNNARGRCVACYATWRRNQPGRCKCCGGKITEDRVATNGFSHDACLAKRRRLWHEYRLKIINAYGGQCSCCGVSDVRFLTIDHVFNDGNEHRKALGGGNRRILLEIINAGYPSTFQVLCFNCNCAKSTNGGVCPHESDRASAHQTRKVPA